MPVKDNQFQPRVGLFDDSDGRDFTIRPKHRAELGVDSDLQLSASIPYMEIRDEKLRGG